MRVGPIALLSSLLALFLSFPAFALELLSPPPFAQLAQGNVVVIGLASGVERGTIHWAGKSTSFRVRDGRFHIFLDLGTGTHSVRFVAGESELNAQWEVMSNQLESTYLYHVKVESGQCKSCHDPLAPPDPGVNVSALCYECHSTYDERSSVHGPVGMGLCSVCHDPHGAVGSNFLRMDPEDLCTYCHNQPVTLDHSKRAVDRPCLECHDPHGARRKYNLKSK